jgi:outer membrane protein OmpA-like peptidoglycan-associated protein
MKKMLLLIAVACTTVSVAFAQKDKSGIEYQNLRGPFITNPFGDNWFISVGAGLDYWAPVLKKPFSGIGASSYVIQLGAGKWIHPYWGARVQFNYGKTEPFNYWSLETDGLFHFSNAVGGYKEARFYNAVLVGGFGLTRGFNDRTHNTELTFNAGLMNTFRLAKGLDAYIEMKAVVSPGHFMGINAGHLAMIPSLTFGLTYKFKGRTFYTAESVVDNAVSETAALYGSRIATLEDELAAVKARRHRQPKPVASVAPEVIVEKVPLAVFFPIGKSELGEQEMLNIYYVAEVIKSNPDRVFSVIGIADKETGTAEVNKAISEARAESVRKALIEKGGVDPERLEIKAVGDRVNPFKLPEMNRVVIIE